MKPHEKAEVPTGVIIGSVIAGILLLLALVAVLWKVRNVSYLKIEVLKIGLDFPHHTATLKFYMVLPPPL